MRRRYVEKSDKIQAEPCETKGAQDGAEEKIGMTTLEETSDKNVIMVLRCLQQIASDHKDIHINADTYVDSICFAINDFNHVMEKVTDKIITPEEAVEYFATQFPELYGKGKQISSAYDASLNELCNLTNRTQDERNNCKERLSRLAAIKPKQIETLANDRAAGCYKVAGKAGGVAVKSGCIGAAGGGTILLSAAAAEVAAASAVAACAVEVAATAGIIIVGGAAVATGAALVAGGGALALGLGVKAAHHWSKRSEEEIQQEKNQWKATEAHFSQLTEQNEKIKEVIDREKSLLLKVNLRLESIAKQMLLAKDKTSEIVKCILKRQSNEVRNLMDECEKYKKLRMQTKNTIYPENAVCTTHRHNSRGGDC